MIAQDPPKRILVVDDDTAVRDLVARLLANESAETIKATNGHEALAQFKNQRFDLVITDRFMPLLDGEQLAGAIKQHCPAMPVLLMSGNLIGIANRQLVEGFLLKPFTKIQLLGVVDEALPSWRDVIH